MSMYISADRRTYHVRGDRFIEKAAVRAFMTRFKTVVLKKAACRGYPG